MDLLKYIRNVPDWPKPGIQFKDITTLCQVSAPFKEACDLLADRFRDKGISKVAAIEARGYVFGSVIAYLIDAGFILMRKPGKLPYNSLEVTYDLEYGQDTIEMHVDAIEEGERVLIVDDLLATGGTAQAACNLVEKAGGKVEAIGCVIELTGSLKGRERLSDYEVISLVQIPVEE
ncbi:MAG: adenine phosphoribosyltransferase [Promethearchaeia archaeon]